MYCYLRKNPNKMTLEVAMDATKWIIEQCEKVGKAPQTNFFGGEPMLMWDEIIAQAYDTSIRAGEATYPDGSPILRVGIGWSPQYERLIHVFCKSGGCSLYDLQDFFMEFPGIWGAMAFDGGGSVGVIDKEVGTGVMGYNARKMKTAFVMTAKDSIPLNFPS